VKILRDRIIQWPGVYFRIYGSRSSVFMHIHGADGRHITRKDAAAIMRGIRRKIREVNA